jgi:Reverse transcriptase (RNA-dependent DNA polymerase)
MTKILHSLLSVRDLNFHINGQSMETRRAFLGLPQGSSLSPLMYNIYNHGIDLCLEGGCHIVQYADDIVIYCFGRNALASAEAVQRTCNKIIEYFFTLGLQISPEKSQSIVFSRKHKPSDIQISLNGSVVENSGSVQYLGINLDRKLNGKGHIEYLVRKCQNRVNFMRMVLERGGVVTRIAFYFFIKG